MTINIYNTLTHKKEMFVPLNKGEVSMYVCGITPYNEVHLGHARAYVTFDIIRRHLVNRGYKVKYIQNFTDIDDKIIKRSIELKVKTKELADRYIDDYFIQMDKLNVLRATSYPKVTENIPQIIDFVKTLIEKGFAYENNGDVYFSVRKFPAYGKLSNRSVDDLKIGARVEPGNDKNDPLDFALWKKTKEGEPEEVSFESPWGWGRPGWHIECSVMSTNSLSNTIDIHGGGQDLIFPHHENEIAQSETATGEMFSKYWIHNGFVTINQEKMSKSLGNFFTIKDILTKFSPRAVRYFLLTQHYKTPLDFSDDRLHEAQKALKGIDDAYLKLLTEIVKLKSTAGKGLIEDVVSTFTGTLDDDFNTEKALAILHELKNSILTKLYSGDATWLNAALNTLGALLEKHLGISVPVFKLPEDIARLTKEREISRKNKDYKKSDNIRNEISKKGFFIIDNPDGTSTIIPSDKQWTK